MNKNYYFDAQVFDLASFRLIDNLRDTFGPNLAKMPEDQLFERAMQAFERVANGLITNKLAMELETTKEDIEDSLIAQADEIVEEVVSRLCK